MAYLGWNGDLNTPGIQQTSGGSSTINAVVVRALNDTMITASATTNPFFYPNLTLGTDTPTAKTTSSVAQYGNVAAAEFAVGGSMRDLYSELVSPTGPIARCLRQLPLDANRGSQPIYWQVRPIPLTNRWVLQMDY